MTDELVFKVWSGWGGGGRDWAVAYCLGLAFLSGGVKAKW